MASEYSLELCLEFAEHLRRTGQGIINPGGYAVSIYRSGVADVMVRKYLSDKERTVVADHPASDGSRLTPEQVAERAALVLNLLDGGYTPEQVETQFAGSFLTQDWELIKAAYTPVHARDV